MKVYGDRFQLMQYVLDEVSVLFLDWKFLVSKLLKYHFKNYVLNYRKSKL